MNIIRKQIGLIFALALAGCQSSSDVSRTKQSELLMLAFDYSGSTEHLRRQLLDKCLELGTELDVTKSDFILFRFASKVEEVYSGVPADEDAFAIQLKGALLGSDPAKGTQYAKMVDILARRATESKEEHIRIVIQGDGLDDFHSDPSLATMYRKAAKSLLSNPKVGSITFWGVDAAARSQLRAIFANDHGKLRLKTMDQALD